MRIALICPSNMLYMPYVNNYEKLLKLNNVKYDLINWDRFQIEDKKSELKYRDSKIGHQRNFLDYYRYKKFIVKKLNENKYDKIIVFGIILSYFLKRILNQKYKDKYILDIRDYHKILKYYDIKSVIDNSVYTILSSPGFKRWLPNCGNYLINHNTHLESLEELCAINSNLSNERINIANIGALRDYDINIKLINSLENNEKFRLSFSGEGIINDDLQFYLKERAITNVFLTGKYIKSEEYLLYKESDLINVLLSNDINSKTLLPNRLYNASLYGKPVITIEGTFLAEEVKKYKLGLALNSFDNIELKIEEYFKSFNFKEFNDGRILFFSKVIQDNKYFKEMIEEFILIEK